MSLFFLDSDYGRIRFDGFVFAVFVSEMAGRCLESQRCSAAGLPGRNQKRLAGNVSAKMCSEIGVRLIDVHFKFFETNAVGCSL